VRLHDLLTRLSAARDDLKKTCNRHVPLLVKLSADLTLEELSDTAQVAVASGIEGIIASNTTTERPDLRSGAAGEAGGLSGAPLRTRALRAVAHIRQAVGSKLVIIGVGGVMCADDAQALRTAGADLVQVYTGLVYRGPALIREILASDRADAGIAANDQHIGRAARE